MQQRTLGPFQVSAISLGCMNFAYAYGTPPGEDEAARLLLKALDLGITMFDTAALYGFDLAALKPYGDKVGPTVAELATPLTEMPENPNEALIKSVKGVW